MNSSGYLAPAAASAGDVNGDGFDDVVVSALGAEVNGQASGSTFVVFGKAAGDLRVRES